MHNDVYLQAAKWYFWKLSRVVALSKLNILHCAPFESKCLSSHVSNPPRTTFDIASMQENTWPTKTNVEHFKDSSNRSLATREKCSAYTGPRSLTGTFSTQWNCRMTSAWKLKEWEYERSLFYLLQLRFSNASREFTILPSISILERFSSQHFSLFVYLTRRLLLSI